MKTRIEISATAVKHNIKTVRKLLKKETRLCAVVKANAYGHGLAEVAKLAIKNNADWLAVDSVEEGIILRQNKIKQPIIVLGYIPVAELGFAVKNNLSLTVYNYETLKKLPKGARIHIKIETGTGRQGVFIKDLENFVKAAQKKGIIIEGMSSHFANVEDTKDSSFALGQLALFSQARAIMEKCGERPICHIACSAAIFLYKEAHFDMVRLGISLYGLWSIDYTLYPKTYTLKPVLTWKTIVAQIKEYPAGTPIGYGLSERLSRASKIAVLPVGYYDGYDRKLSRIGEVLIKGRRCKVLGRVCMNMTMVDITDVAGVKVEDEVVLLGKQGKEVVTTEDLAEKIGTINYEVVTRVNPLIKRIVC